MADEVLLELLRTLVEKSPEARALLTAAANAPRVVKAIGELWDGWMPWAEANIPSWRVNKNHAAALRKTQITLDDARRLSMFELPWTECTPHAADLYKTARRKMPNGRGGTISPTTIDRELSSLQAMLSYWHRTRREIDRNPINGFKRVDSEEHARQTSLTPAQVKQFLEAGPPMFQDIGWVAYRCAGMRNTEARCLKKSEIDWESKTINLPNARNKNRKPRPVPFPDDVEVILRRHCDVSRSHLVFVSPQDPRRQKAIPSSTMQRWLEKAREDSGVVGFDGENVVIHTLRHSGVTQLVEDGAPETYVKRASGLGDKTFRRYSHFNRPQQEALRSVMNRSVTPPAPITSALGADRVNPRRADIALVGPRKTVADE